LVAIGVYSPFHLSWKFRNGDLLQLVECIELLKNEVKKKMMMQERFVVVPKSQKGKFAREIFARVDRKTNEEQNLQRRNVFNNFVARSTRRNLIQDRRSRPLALVKRPSQLFCRSAIYNEDCKIFSGA
jgi:hypothetical protein